MLDTLVVAMPYPAKVGILQSQDEKQNAIRFQAATTHLDLAITFYLVASATKDRVRSSRALANAQQAYAIAASYLDCNLQAGQNIEIEEKIVLLNAIRARCRRSLRHDNGVGGSSCETTVREQECDLVGLRRGQAFSD